MQAAWQVWRASKWLRARAAIYTLPLQARGLRLGVDARGAAPLRSCLHQPYHGRGCNAPAGCQRLERNGARVRRWLQGQDSERVHAMVRLQ